MGTEKKGDLSDWLSGGIGNDACCIGKLSAEFFIVEGSERPVQHAMGPYCHA